MHNHREKYNGEDQEKWHPSEIKVVVMVVILYLTVIVGGLYLIFR